MNFVRSIVFVSVCVLVAHASSASAQWVWKDESGHTVASDQPPPVGTPPARIVKSPRPRSEAPAAASAAAPAAAKPADAPDAAKSIADRDLEAKQHAKEAAEAQKKSDEDAAKAKAMAENCSTVRGNLAGLQQGGRTARVNERGEKTYLDDNQRAAEIQKAQSQIAQYCR